MKKSKKILIAATLAVAGILVFSIARALVKKLKGKQTISIEQIHREKGIPVTVGVAARTNISAVLKLDAIIAPNERATVMSQVAERITKIHVDEGDRVQAGKHPTLLVELDDSAITARKEAAEKSCAEAKRDLERSEKLLEKGAISQQEYDRAEVTLKSARANLADAESMLIDCRIYSPINGTVSCRHVEPGSVAQAATLLIEIVDTSRLEAELRIPETQAPLVRLGMPCRVLLDALGKDKSIKTSITAINPELDPVTRYLKATCRIDNPTPGIVPGMFGTATVEYDSRDNALVLPGSAIVQKEDLSGVFVIENGNTARFREIETGLQYNGNIEIVSGISEEDTVVIDGMSQISDGNKVQATGRAR